MCFRKFQGPVLLLISDEEIPEAQFRTAFAQKQYHCKFIKRTCSNCSKILTMVLKPYDPSMYTLSLRSVCNTVKKDSGSKVNMRLQIILK